MNGANIPFSVQNQIFTKIKAKISQMRHQNIQEGSSFTEERKKSEIFSLSPCFHQSKIVFFRFF